MSQVFREKNKLKLLKFEEDCDHCDFILKSAVGTKIQKIAEK
jgi:hypothetical protein